MTRTFRVRVWIDADLCVLAADLPGCRSMGSNIKDCLRNVREAFTGVALCHLSRGEDIPWLPGGPRPLFHEERWITVHVRPESDADYPLFAGEGNDHAK